MDVPEVTRVSMFPNRIESVIRGVVRGVVRNHVDAQLHVLLQTASKVIIGEFCPVRLYLGHERSPVMRNIPRKCGCREHRSHTIVQSSTCLAADS